ncbi:Transposable element Tcb1 transposase [Histomonas meleagridis]|uniref:Transposable element Tcb1 transposase n=1 Tax=Histomonas meleagridis TaxID=135588 RepID=UPI00355A9D99|nr:Transposable element Tcb1 transposase [Histomonas meleagridis]KAH0798020.1 Transposable element Tcb1 transposase [Histomonas meleagridis]
MQQDNAKPHISNETYMLHDDFGVNFMEDWPPYSPDQNIIETVWAIMKKRLEAKPCKTIDELKKIIQDIWILETINRLVEAMQNRIQACIQENGSTVLNY